MAEPAPEHLAALLELADVDASIRRLQVALDDLPETRRITEIDEQTSALQRQRADVGLQRDEAAATVRKHERSVGHLEERMAAEQQRMYEGGITNARELSSLEAEIAAVQAKIDREETAELEAMETMDQHESTIAEIDDTLRELATTRAETDQARDESAAGLLAEVAEHEVRRDELRDQLPDDLVATYDEAAERHRGNAVGRLDGNRCTACGIGLSGADVNTLIEGPPLSNCPNCDRLIVVE